MSLQSTLTCSIQLRQRLFALFRSQIRQPERTKIGSWIPHRPDVSVTPLGVDWESAAGWQTRSPTV